MWCVFKSSIKAPPPPQSSAPPHPPTANNLLWADKGINSASRLICSIKKPFSYLNHSTDVFFGSRLFWVSVLVRDERVNVDPSFIFLVFWWRSRVLCVTEDYVVLPAVSALCGGLVWIMGTSRITLKASSIFKTQNQLIWPELPSMNTFRFTFKCCCWF